MQKGKFSEKIREKIRIHKKKVFNSRFLRCFLVSLFYGYIRLVFFTSRIKVNDSASGLEEIFKKNKSIIFSLWHQDIILANFAVKAFRWQGISYEYSALASKHNDGRMISDVISFFNKTKIIYGSSNSKRRVGKGIDVSSFRKIFQTLKKPNQCFLVTPDGPRGPAKEIKGHVCNIAVLTKTPIVTLKCQASKKIVLDSWDNFVIPLPFSKIKISFSSPIFFDKKQVVNSAILQKSMP